MKLAKTCLLPICLLALAGCSQKPALKPSAEELRQELARRLCFREVTNEVTGVREIIDLHVNAHDENCTNWKAEATVEYINHLGGVDRTNLHLAYAVLQPERATNVTCGPDFNWYLQDNLARYHREMERAGKEEQ